jgi:tetrahydromethanopterin S-methyltransferase subunit B
MLSASEAFIAVVAPLVDLVPVAEEVVDEVVEVVEVVELVFDPAVPPSTAVPGRLTVAFAWKFARVRVAFAVGLEGSLLVQVLFYPGNLIWRGKEKGKGKDILDVNNHRHSKLAMLSLRTIQPDRRGVVDHNRICRRHLRCSSHRHESRKDTRCAWAVQSDGLAWLIEG